MEKILLCDHCKVVIQLDFNYCPNCGIRLFREIVLKSAKLVIASHHLFDGFTWYQAMNISENFKLGSENWRIPTINEFRRIYNVINFINNKN